MTKYDAIIVGGSASGLCAAIQAARIHEGASIAVLEKMPRVGKKIMVTGNGRCNLSNINAAAHPYHNAGFVKPALTKYTVESTLSFFRSLALLTVTDSEGRIYPMSNTAASVLNVLRFEAESLGIEMVCGTAVERISVSKDGLFTLNCSQNEESQTGAGKDSRISINYNSHKAIIAAGGKASPAHGSDGSGFALLKQLGHSITPLFPALVQLNTDSAYPKQLKGIRVHANISVEINGNILSDANGEVLFTEYGLSGIAAMDISRCVSEYFSMGKKSGCYAILDLTPDLNKEELTAFLTEMTENHPNLSLDKFLIGILPNRVGQVICKVSNLHDFSINVGSIKKHQLDKIVDTIKSLRLPVTGTRDFTQAQVTAGGADVREFNPHTLESRKVKSLYCCGEILDVDGGCGGFNLQWAWSSGLLAGELG